MKKNGRKFRWLRPLVLAGIVAAAAGLILIPFLSNAMHPVRYIRSETNKLEVKKAVMNDGEVDEEVYTIPRGAKVTVDKKGEKYSSILYHDQLLSVPNENLVESKTECVDFDYVYPRKLVNLRDERQGKLTDTVAQKGEALKVVSVLASDLDPETGEISWFEVEKDGKHYWLAGTNLEMTQENALKDYSTDIFYNPVYDKTYGKGFSQDAYINQTDLKGKTKVSWDDNPLRTDIQGVHITLENVIKYKDDLIRMKNESGLNTLVIALKGPDGKLAYQSDVPKDYFKSTDGVLSNTLMTKNELAALIKELKNSGFYIIGRIEAFMDASLAFDRRDLAITDSQGNPAYYSQDYWVSPYNREVWSYNADLAKEAAKMGVNEVQFDFCRFPDGLTQDQANGLVNIQNTYNESKPAAIQGFLYYVGEELEPYHVYTSADMYGGPVIDSYDYDIGHFVPAIAAAADVVCPMMYLDTFDVSSYGFTDLDGQARQILEAFTNDAVNEFKTVPNPGIMRIWIQGYNNTTADRTAREIQGIMDAGVEGYLLWTDEGDLDTLKFLEPGMIDSTPWKNTGTQTK